MAERKYVQIMKRTGLVNLVGDETLGMEPADNEIALIFDISSHPQNAEIKPYMKYDAVAGMFYWPEPEPGPPPDLEPSADERLDALMEGYYGCA